MSNDTAPHSVSATADTASTEESTDPRLQELIDGYAMDVPVVPVGCALVDETAIPEVTIGIPVAMFNRHGLIAGATGTGKTRTLQLIAEGLSQAGVPVFLTDVKGDLTGIAGAGDDTEKMRARTAAQGQHAWQPQAFPSEFYTLGNGSADAPGVPVRATVASFGPILLARALDLNVTQTQALQLIFAFAQDHDLRLDDLKDLKAVVTYLTNNDKGKEELRALGGVSTATAGVILRSVSALSAQGGDEFFGLPQFDPADFIRCNNNGKGLINIMRMTDLFQRPALVSAFIMWLLNQLFENLPEMGDAEKPKLVFFFDEAHLLFDGASEGFLKQVEQTVKLIRSKGVGIFFITQTPKDVPPLVLGQLGSRVQHALRAFTPEDLKAVKSTVETFPVSQFDVQELLVNLGVGEALVTVLDKKGRPSPVAPTKVWAPQSIMGPWDPAEVKKAVDASTLNTKYGEPVDEISAAEELQRQREAAAQAAEAAVRAAQPAQAVSAANSREAAAQPAATKPTAEERAAIRQAEKEAAAKAKENERRKKAALRTTKRVVRNVGRSVGQELSRGDGPKKVFGNILKAIFSSR